LKILRPALRLAAAALVGSGIPHGGNAAGPFDTRLSQDRQVLQALNRLTFGPRAEDGEQVRRLGVEKWIELQLHPERIPENPVLEAKLKPLETLHMDVAEILKQYYPQFPPGFVRPTPLTELLQPDEMRKVLNGTAEERKAALVAMSPEKRDQVLARVGPNVLEGLPELQQEATMARQKEQEERNKQTRMLRPPLNELLTPDQVRTAQRGTWEERQALFGSLEPAKLQQVAVALPPPALADFPELRRMGAVSRQPRQAVVADLREAKLYRALYSNRQLVEVLTDFWFNHFNVFEGKGQQEQATLASYENDAIRPHVLGHFKDLLLGTARHPAMLHYLDNWESLAGDFMQVGPFAPGPGGGVSFLSRQAHGLNENYGREVLELHTLGVNGGYTQADVIAVARCFTGWTIREPNTKPEFTFAAFMHDTGEKTVLGHHIAAGGEESDGLAVIEILAHHPSTARFISKALAQRFVADDPPASLVDRMAKTFLKTDGDLRAVMETMLTSREFFSEGAWQAKMKSPLEMVVSAVRAAGGNTTDSFTLVQKVADMGEPLYGKLEPTGYKDTAETWLSTASVMARIGFASALAAGQVPGVKVDTARFGGKDAAAIAHEVLERDASPQTLAAIERGIEGKPARPGPILGLVIGSPEFQRR
jgi:uncharacterized protein (DUF1800 family)